MTLYNSKQVGRHTTYDPKLLISPPFLYAYSAPPQLKNARREDRDEQSDEKEACKGAYLDSK